MASEKSTMIVEHFPSKKETKVYQLTPPRVPRMPQQQHPIHVASPAPAPAPSTDNAFVKTEKERAEKRGLSLEEYRKRVFAVTKASNACAFQVGDTIFPKNEEDREQYGQCLVTDVCRHYDNYGSVEWFEDNPLILTLKPSKQKDSLITAGIRWGVKRVELDLSGLEEQV